MILLTTLGVTFLAFTAIWLASLKLKDASIVDFYWGPGFAVIACICLAMGPRGPGHLLLAVLITAWGLRLGWYMLRRHGGTEDARYRAMRDNQGEAFGRRSLWMVFWLQALMQWLASSPVLVAALAPADPLMWLLVSGSILFAAGFGLEVLADKAVQQFRSDPSNRGKLLTSGLHARIRHPNYLGEIILQWGLGLVALGLTQNPLALVGPALMTGLIAKLSGVPMLSEQMKARPGYEAWVARTGALLPKL